MFFWILALRYKLLITNNFQLLAFPTKFHWHLLYHRGCVHIPCESVSRLLVGFELYTCIIGGTISFGCKCSINFFIDRFTTCIASNAQCPENSIHFAGRKRNCSCACFNLNKLKVYLCTVCNLGEKCNVEACRLTVSGYKVHRRKVAAYATKQTTRRRWYVWWRMRRKTI